MKKVLLLFAAAAILVTGTDLFAGGVDNNSNMSAEYIRTMNRNGATDAADIAYYNPAGFTKLKPGLSMNISNQSLFIYDWTINTNDTSVSEGAKKEYKSEEPVYLLPNAYFVYRQDNWAGFLSFTIPAGGGSVNFKDGLPSLHDQWYDGTMGFGTYDGSSAEVSQVYYALTMGGTFEVNPMFSIALGVRGLYVDTSYKAELNFNPGVATTYELDAKQTGMGFGGIIGLNIALEGINIGMRYETETSIELENDTSKDDFGMFADGEKVQHNLPAVLGLGAVFSATPELNVGADFTYYFEKQADWDGGEKYFDNSWEVGVFAEYKVTPTLLLSLGYLYSNTAANEDTLNDLGFNLDTHSVGLGCKFSASEELDVNAAFSRTFYIESPESKHPDATGNTYTKVCYLIAVGVNYRLPL